MSNSKKKINIKPFTGQFYRNNAGCIVLAFIQTVMVTGVNLLISWLLQQILDMVSGIDTGFTFAQIIGFAGISIVMIVAAFGCSYFSKPRFVARAMAQYKDFVFQKISQKGIAAFSKENTNLYISALSNDATEIENKYLSNLFEMIDKSVMCVAALAMMLWYSPILTGVSIGLSLLPILASLAAGNRVAVAEKEVSKKNENYMSVLRDSLVGFSVIKSFRAEIHMCRIYAENVKRVSEAKEARLKATIIIQMLSTVAGVIVQIGVFLVGAYLALTGRGVTAGIVLVFVQLLNYVLSPIGEIPKYLAEYKAACGLIEKLAESLEENRSMTEGIGKTTLEHGITMENVSFAYEEEKKILQNINFSFEAGKSYAIVGASGSGKSTILNLLMSSYHGYTGAICFDNAELRNINSEALYDMISVIQQNVFIFNASIQDNITMFSDFPKKEVERAIELSGLKALIVERGEEYLCGENGNGLSGGEKQRISIARSLLKKSQVLLVDEATAALDAQTAFHVSNAILELENMTRIVVTHSLEDTLLRKYDCILTIKNGSLVETGKFEELMEQKGYFYSLYTVSQS